MITTMKKGTSNNDIPKQSNNGNTRNVLGTFFIQTYALTKKNLTLQRRNLTATLTVYFSGCLLLLLIYEGEMPTRHPPLYCWCCFKLAPHYIQPINKFNF